MTGRIYHPHPGGLNDAEWFSNLPDPEGKGRVSMRQVQEYAAMHNNWLRETLNTAPADKRQQGSRPVENRRIQKYIDALQKAYLLTEGGTRPLPETEAYKAISALHREAFGLWPDDMRKKMPFGEVIRRLRQCVTQGGPTQLEKIAQLPGLGLSVGLDLEGDPLFAGLYCEYPGLSYNESCHLTTESGCSLLPRALPSRPGQRYETRMIEAALGEKISPVKSVRGGHGPHEYHPVYVDSTGVKDAQATVELKGKMRDKNAPNPDSYTRRIYVLKDLEPKE